MYTVLQQMKLVFCKRLAACLRIQQSPSPSPEPSFIIRSRSSVSIGDRFNNIPHVDMTINDVTVPKNETAEKLLREIRDLLASGRQNEEEQCYEADKENEMKKDWMLAAAVLDRICAIAFAIIFIGGTLTFAVVLGIQAV